MEYKVVVPPLGESVVEGAAAKLELSRGECGGASVLEIVEPLAGLGSLGGIERAKLPQESRDPSLPSEELDAERLERRRIPDRLELGG